MKKIISVLVIICWLGLPGKAQNGGPQAPNGSNYQQPNGNNGGAGRQRPKEGSLEPVKIGFISSRLKLTNEEAEKFWPIYHRYAAEIRQVRQAYQANHDEIALDEGILNVKKKYSVEFGKVLSPEKVNEFFRAEKDFGAWVQKEFQRRQMQVQPRKPLAGE